MRMDKDHLKKQMLEVMRVQPNLTENGLDARGHYEKTIEEFDAARKHMLTSQALASFYVGKKFIDEMNAIKTFNHNHSSYGYKHMAERRMGYSVNGCNVFVSNGMLIAAALCRGYKIKADYSSINCLINISERPINAMSKNWEIQPRADHEYYGQLVKAFLAEGDE